MIRGVSASGPVGRLWVDTWLPLGGVAEKEAVALGDLKSFCDQSWVETGLVEEDESQDPSEGLSNSEYSVDVGFFQPFGRRLMCVLVPGRVDEVLPPFGVAGDAGDKFFGPTGKSRRRVP